MSVYNMSVYNMSVCNTDMLKRSFKWIFPPFGQHLCSFLSFTPLKSAALPALSKNLAQVNVKVTAFCVEDCRQVLSSTPQSSSLPPAPLVCRYSLPQR